ncbi:MAG: hypothetical protein IIU57_04360, partial [Oscillospiraceae bacterium]|nr:hypothetical protein [Oscillospiraceae bacterium]
MKINSLMFLYLFLPAALIVFNLTPQKFKKISLVAVSFAFIALSQPENFLFILADIVFIFILSKSMYKNRENPKIKKALFVFALISSAAVIIVSSVSNQIYGRFAPFAAMIISFTAIGYFVDLYKNETEPIDSFFDFAVFLAFFG